MVKVKVERGRREGEGDEIRGQTEKLQRPRQSLGPTAEDLGDLELHASRRAPEMSASAKKEVYRL